MSSSDVTGIVRGQPAVRRSSGEAGGRMNSRTDIQRFMILEGMKNHSRSYQHPSYLMEQQLCESIRRGDRQAAFRTLDHINSLERAELADDPIRSLKNSLIGSCTIFARAAISGGVDSESAFMLSDLYIRQIEKMTSRQGIESLEYDMLMSFVQSVSDSRRASEEAEYSPLVARAREYIRNHAQKHLALADIAEHVNVHPNYLSGVFSKECGQPIMQFYDAERTEAISQFLRLTDISLADLAMNFEFTSFSHFSSFFKKQTGVTPRDFRRQSQSETVH